MEKSHSKYSQVKSCLLVMAFLASSCGTSDTETEKSLEDSDMESKKEAVLRNDLNQAISHDLIKWTAHWETLLGEIQANNFDLVMTDTIDPMEMPELNPIKENDPLRTYQFPHPTGDGCIDIYSYKIEAQGDSGENYLNPDSEVVWYRKDGMKERLLFMGPSGMFEDGAWVEDNKFVVLGYFQGVTGYRPMAWVLDLNQHVLYQFQMDKVIPDYNTTSYLNTKIRQIDIN